jgi:LPS-assembly protein
MAASAFRQFSGGRILVRLVWWAVFFAIGSLPAAQAQQPAAPAQPRTAGLTQAGAMSGSAAGDAAQTNVDSASGLRVAPKLTLHSNISDNDMSAFTIADKMETDEQGRVILKGSAEVRRIDSVVKGDYIDYDRATGQARVRGNGLIMRDGGVVTGSSLDFNVNSDTGEVYDANFWTGATGGSGTASHVDIFSKTRMRLKDATYAGCPCPDPAWYISSPQVDLDFDENEGVARHGVLYFKDVPILYSPYLTFPVKKERKSGFLLPTYGTTSRSGFEFTLPYYFNLAPNYDATLSPRYLSKRGLQLGGQFRYLGRGYSGQIDGTYLPSDNQTGEKRWLFMSQHKHNFGNGFRAVFDIRRVSDDDYFRDFSSFGLRDSTVSYLPSTARLYWSGYKYFSARLSVNKYQTLQDSTRGSYIRPQYDREPELFVRGARYNWGGFDLVSENYATKFKMPFYSGRYSGSVYDPWRSRHIAPDGTRLSSYTTLSYPIVRAGWYVTPKIGLHMSQYSTDWYRDDLPTYAGRPDTITRVLPIASIDAGMTFERNTTLFGNKSIQTLEPRIYYLRVPYRDQSDIPIYDTSIATFNFAQAFDENIFSGGWDRIANANQVTVGLTTRWLDEDTGFERLSLSAAQRLYFEDQKVSLRSETLRTNHKSDYLFGASAALTDKLNVRFDAQYNPDSRDRNRMSIGLRWLPKRLTTLSLSYRYERDPRLIADPTLDIDEENLRTREQVSLAGQWPITKKIYAMGRYDYSFGLEYKGDCCWTARVVMQRYAVSREDVNSAIFFQLELAGLGSIGSDPMSLLRDRVIGYESVNPPTPEKTTFERYE